jgi:hypothetical protein
MWVRRVEHRRKKAARIELTRSHTPPQLSLNVDFGFGSFNMIPIVHQKLHHLNVTVKRAIDSG